MYERRHGAGKTTETEMTSSLSVAMVAAVAIAAGAFGSSSYGRAWNRGRIYVAGLIPLTSDADGDARAVDDDTSAPDILQAILMAVNHVNRNRRILPKHDLYLVWNDTKVCDPLFSVLNNFAQFSRLISLLPVGMRSIAKSVFVRLYVPARISQQADFASVRNSNHVVPVQCVIN